MSNIGRLSGVSWHIEYHTTDKKKHKVADCIYLSDDRICNNKDSVQYLSKCFIASYCHLRVKEADAEKHAKIKAAQTTSKPKQPEIKEIKCTLPLNCHIHSNKFGNGKFVGYDENSMLIYVQFGDKTIRFQYPNAILQKYITLPKHAFKQVLYDISKAKKE